jgi:hypothetical protein
MTRPNWQHCSVLALALALAAIFLSPAYCRADPSKYPEFAQQKLPDDVTPEFISVDELLSEVRSGKKPVIIDVRSEEEFHEVHIVGALSAPLGEFNYHLKNIPRDRPVVLY